MEIVIQHDPNQGILAEEDVHQLAAAACPGETHIAEDPSSRRQSVVDVVVFRSAGSGHAAQVQGERAVDLQVHRGSFSCCGIGAVTAVQMTETAHSQQHFERIQEAQVASVREQVLGEHSQERDAMRL